MRVTTDRPRRRASSAFLRFSNLAAVVCAICVVSTGIAATVEPVTNKPWREAVISVTDPDITARFFKEIGGYEELGRGSLSASAVAAWGLAPEARGKY